MTHRRDVNLAHQPALVPMFGGQDKKPRPLDRDVITIGRARACDIGLEAPEVSTLHCLVYRSPEGFRVRDCASRTGVRINGEPPRNHVLANGDVLQIGPFSFSVSLPPSLQFAPPKVDPARLAHYQHSRRKLAQLAVQLRKRLQLAGANGSNVGHTDLTRKANDLRKRIHHYDERLSQLEAAERDLERDREQLRRDRERHDAHVQQVEGDLASRLEAAEREIHDRWQEFQRRCQHEEHEKVQGVEKLQREREELQNMKKQLSAEQGEASASLEKQRAALSQAEAALREQRTELGRMMGELRALQESIKKQQGVNTQALVKENEDLRRMLTEYEKRVVELEDNRPAASSPEVADLKGENELLHQLLQERDGVVEELKQQVEELKNQPQPEPQQQAKAPTNSDLENYEAELNQYRQQLEADRAKLNKEVEQLRSRNAEMDEAIREMEMEMSKERAELARERTRLDRLREEVRSEVERMQRDGGMRESLAHVQKLREEMVQKKSPAKDDGKALTDRLKSFRKGLTE